MWLKLLLEIMTILVPVEGEVTAAMKEAAGNDPMGTKIVNISALAQRIVQAAAPIIEDAVK